MAISFSHHDFRGTEGYYVCLSKGERREGWPSSQLIVEASRDKFIGASRVPNTEEILVGNYVASTDSGEICFPSTRTIDPSHPKHQGYKQALEDKGGW